MIHTFFLGHKKHHTKEEEKEDDDDDEEERNHSKKKGIFTKTLNFLDLLKITKMLIQNA